MNLNRVSGTLVLLLGFSCVGLFADTSGNENSEGECTIGVAAGKATTDGRPLLWKTRDMTSSPDNEVYYNSTYGYVCVVSNPYYYEAWKGVNKHGFAICNSVITDFPVASTGEGNSAFMTSALKYCKTVADFQHCLDSTNGARKTNACFGVMDSTGAAAIFETSGFEYWKYDANDTSVAPDGFVVRTNFAFNCSLSIGYSEDRYYRSLALIQGFADGDSLCYRTVLRTQMRDFSNGFSVPFSVPFDSTLSGARYGYIPTAVSICRSGSVSATVFQGVLEGENPRFSTMWTILGQPAAGIAVPYWPVAKTCSLSYSSDSTALLCNIDREIRKQLYDYSAMSTYINTFKLFTHDSSRGLWTITFPAEDSIFQAADSILSVWRSGVPDSAQMQTTNADLAFYAYSTLCRAYDTMVNFTTRINLPELALAPPTLFSCYPNPANLSTRIRFYLPEKNRVRLEIYDIRGVKIRTLLNHYYNVGTHEVEYSPDEKTPSGVYVCLLRYGSSVKTENLILLK